MTIKIDFFLLKRKKNKMKGVEYIICYQLKFIKNFFKKLFLYFI